MNTDWTRVLGWPGYRVYDYQIDETRRHLTLWVRRKRGNRKLTCSHCGRRVHDIHAVYERTARDLPCFQFQTTVVVELYRIRCPDCGVKAERSEQLPSKAPYSKRFEDAVGEACEGAAARQVARRMRLAESTVRAIDLTQGFVDDKESGELGGIQGEPSAGATDDNMKIVDRVTPTAVAGAANDLQPILNA